MAGVVPNPAAISVLGQQVLNCICTTLDGIKATTGFTTYPGCPTNACVTFGTTPPMDLIDADCGMLRVAIGAIYPSAAFPRQDQNLVDCIPKTIVCEVHVNLYRCVPTIHENGSPPSCTEVTAMADTLSADMLGMMAAMRCCVPTANGGHRQRRVRVTRISNIPETGGIGGTNMTALVDLGEQCECAVSAS